MEPSASPPNASTLPTPPRGDNGPRILATESRSLAFLFGILYFIQGISEPSEGLIAQPLRSMLDSWGHSVTQIGLFGAFLSIPWTIKPLFGLISDFVPFFGLRRKSYLIATSIFAFLGMMGLFFWPPSPGSYVWLLVVLLVPTTCVAFADVVIDALMVEKGQPVGITGRLQAVQWSSIYGATILTGEIGGLLTATHRQDLGFLICGLAMLPALFLSLIFVHEQKRAKTTASWRNVIQEARQAVTKPALLAIGTFIFLWNFNPFSSTVLQLHMKHEMHLKDQFIGRMTSLQAFASVCACICYGFYCRKLTTRQLVHGSIVLGILSTIGYWFIWDEPSTVVVSLAAGFTYMTANLIQLDLAARICPPRVAGTVFSLLMSLSNLAVSLSIGLGGYLYDLGTDRIGSATASFHIVVAMGAAFTACCWWLLPWLTVEAPEA